MMAGTGVSAGGAGMLRTRRRDVSVKPNRKLDRKSSRGMIYENEELRLRTIHINAEVEQGQNDIKKLRRENEQLRREIWSLRDEYDKLEEILKRQKNQDESEEYEDRSEEDEDAQSDYSCEEDEGEPAAKEIVVDEEVPEDCSTKEQLENVENDKISSEKMSNSLHRLHVDFDDLSVVDEEEELKKEKERRDVTSPDAQGKNPVAVRPRQLHDNIPFYPAGYAPSNTFDSASYYRGCPFDFPNTTDLMLPSETSTLLASPPTRLRADPLVQLASLEAASLEQVGQPMLPQLHVPPAGWRTNVVLPAEQSSYPTIAATSALQPTGIEVFTEPRFPRDGQDQQRFTSTPAAGASRKPGFFERRKQSPNPKDQDSFGELGMEYSNAEVHPTENGWLTSVNASSGVKIGDYGESRSKKAGNASMEGMFTFDGSEKPKHFFSPLPSKLRRQVDEGSPTPSSSQFGTGTSSSSGRTGSTVISKSHFPSQKGCADIYVNGAVPYEQADKEEQKAFLSTDNLLMGDNRSTMTQLMKSISCQDLTETQSVASGQLRTQFGEKPQMFTQSDNTLDSTSNETSKPYKSHLNVTLKPPRSNQTMSPNPATPKLPSINYRLFNNPFLKTFDPTRQHFSEQDTPVTRPLSIQVNDDNPYYNYPSPPNMSSFSRKAHTVDRHTSRGQSDRNRLLIPMNQLFSSKTMSPRSKPELQITSFERPSPHTLVSPALGYDLGKLRRINASPYVQNRNLYQNVPFVQEAGTPHFYPASGPMRLYYEQAPKVSTQTQTSIDGDSHRDDEQILSHPEEESASTPSSPSGQRLRKARKEKEPSAISPGGHRRLKKQSSVTSSETIDSPSKAARKRPRKLSVTTTTASEGGQEDKNESRSSSSGQDSPRKEQTRRVSLYFNAKKRPSLTSVKTTRSASVDTTKDKYLDGSERERTNSISSRETSVKPRKASTSSGSVPWCACWGNGCI